MLNLTQICLAAFANVAFRASDPIPFSEALQAREIKSVLPTDLTTAQLAKIEAAILERATFSAQVAMAEYLQEIDDVVAKMLSGKLDLATARLQLKDKLDLLGYTPTPDEAGGLTDFASDARINLVLNMNTSMAQGYGTWLQGQNDTLLNSRPAQELYRAYHRKVPRDWIARWRDAGGQFFNGKMIALKNEDIWIEISRFGTPYPPFDFNSGMSVRDVDRKTAMDIGLIDLTTKIEPLERGFNDDLKFSPDLRSAALRQVLEEEGYQFQTIDGTEVLTL